jgi:8-oxo-dGTP diphosphatase
MEVGKDCIGIGCGVLIFDKENRLFLIKRSNNAKVRAGEWSVPGGKVSFGEKAEDATIRETLEEIGIKVKINKFIGYSDEINGPWHWLLLYFLAERFEGQPRLCEPQKHDEMGWFKLTELPENVSFFHVITPLKQMGLLPVSEKREDTMVIGAVGYIGAGKDAALDIIAEKFNFKKISIGDFARNIAQKRGLDASRENLHDISVEFFRKFGNDYFSKKVIEEIEQCGFKKVAVSGIRTMSDIRSLKDYFGKNFILIYVDASRETRFQRLAARGEARDSKSMEEFTKQEKEEDMKFGISEAITYSDYTIKNDGDKSDLQRNISGLIGKLTH